MNSQLRAHANTENIYGIGYSSWLLAKTSGFETRYSVSVEIT